MTMQVGCPDVLMSRSSLLLFQTLHEVIYPKIYAFLLVLSNVAWHQNVSISLSFGLCFSFSFFTAQYISDSEEYLSEQARALTGVDVADAGILFRSGAYGHSARSIRCTKWLRVQGCTC